MFPWCHDLFNTRGDHWYYWNWGGQSCQGLWRWILSSWLLGAHHDRAGRAGCGVMLYAKRHLNPIQIPIVTPFKIVGVSRGGRFFLRTFPKALLVYWPSLWISVCLGLGEYLHLGGDFNCPGVNWETNFAMGKGLHLMTSTNVLDLILSSQLTSRALRNVLSVHPPFPVMTFTYYDNSL